MVLRFWKMNCMCLLLCVSVDVEHILSESESDETWNIIVYN